MLTEDYCSYDVAKLLKSKGFNDVYSKGDCTAFACTHQMAIKWLREVHELFVDISFVKDEHQEEKLFWFYAIFELSNNNAAHYNNVDEFTTYEEAVEAALKYCLTNLI